MRQTLLRGVLPAAVAALALTAALAVPARPAFAFPPAGTDVLDVSASVSVTSRLGSETFQLAGTVEVTRGDPYIDAGVSVVDLEIVALDLTGQSLTGSIAATESVTQASVGEIRSQQAGTDYPADLFLDAFIVILAPASPNPTIQLQNSAPLHLAPSFGAIQLPISAWPPPQMPPLVADTSPCVPLIPADPIQACITALSVAFGAAPGAGAVGGFTELPAPAGPSASSGLSGASERALGFPIAIGAAIGGFALFAVAAWWRARTKS